MTRWIKLVVGAALLILMSRAAFAQTAPVVSDIPDQTIAEGATFATINLDDFVADVEDADADISWVATGQTELTVTIDASRVATITIPNINWFGSETVTFTATDLDLQAGADAATFTVTSVNDNPVVSDIGDQTIAEGATFATINLDDFVADVEDADADISWVATGQTELTVTIDAGRVATITIPNINWFGSEAVTFTATDLDLGTGFDAATFTVSSVNDAPVVSDIGDQTIAEGATFATINLDDFVTDVEDVDADISWVVTGQTELTVTIDASRVATITIPNINWFGSEAVTFTATDLDLGTGFDAATFTVTSVNDNPVVSDIGDQTIAEGATFATINLDDFVADVEDADADISWVATGQSELTVTIDAGRVATITIPDINWFGSETVTFTATDLDLGTGFDAATFTVTSVNDDPVVSNIGDQTIAEGATFATINLDDFVADVEDADTDISWVATGQSELTVTIDASRVATITIPNINWFGSETVTFTATDLDLGSGFDAATFTVTSVNDNPVVTDIGDQTIAEGATFLTINLDDFVSDVEDADADISWVATGQSELTVTIDAGRVATITIPNINWFGSETVTFTATDLDLGTGFDAATFTVTSVNDDPVVSDIGDQTIAEGATFATINLDDFVTDVEDADADISWVASGQTELTVTIDAGRVATITIPDINWFGSETVTFTATDLGLLSGFDAATFTVTAVNDNPVVSDIGDQTIAEGATFATINLDDFVSDVEDADADISWVATGQSELTVTIDAGRVATITIPNINWFGSETVTFTATDLDLGTGFDAATFTVTADNDAPVVSDIPDQTIAEGATFATINLDDFVSDVEDADADISWVATGQTELTVTIDAGRVATITIPNINWFGSETVTFTGTDLGLLSGFDAATFTVTAVNDNPVVSDIGDQTIAEGATFATINLDDFVADVEDADADISWVATGQTELTVTIDASRVATITIPNVNWFGSEAVTFTATDLDLGTGFDAATFTVTSVNDNPVVSDIGDQTIAEGATFATINLDDFVADVEDADADISWVASGQTELTVTIDAGRVATITIPNINWFGSETVTFTATDLDLGTGFDAATFTVTSVNDNPVVTDIGDQTIAEGATFLTINLDDFVSDVEDADADISWVATGQSELTVTIDAGRVATITIPNINWFGSETVTFTATDLDLGTGFDAATFTVTSVNDNPVVTDIGDQTIAEGATFLTINLDDFVSDVEDADADISWVATGQSELTVTIDAGRVATITIPNINWFGSEAVTFTATDLDLGTGFDAATFTVTGDNDAPVVSDIPDQTIAEGATFATINLDDFVTDVEDADADISWVATGQTELTVTIDAGRVATITIPNVNWFGSETVTFTATDLDLGTGFDAATFTVTSVNDDPVVSDIGDQTIAEGATFATINLDDFVTDVEDADADISWVATGQTELTVTIDAGRVATITIPNINWFGSETVTFTATDLDLGTGFDAATFTVTSVNDAPVVSDIGDQTIAEGATFATINLDDFVSDVEDADTDISWVASGQTELTVTIDASRVATITIPNINWFGSETVTFTATDLDLGTGFDAATFTVTSVNDNPVVTDIGDQTIAEGATFLTINLDDFVTDVEDADADISWVATGQTELTVTIDAGRVATITIPNVNWFGSETVTFTATDLDLGTGFDAAAFTVTSVNDAPVVSDIGDQTIAEGATFATINLDNFVSDVEDADADISWVATGQTELTVTIDASRVATITIPNINWFGSETVTFTATDLDLGTGFDAATFTVTADNDAPVVSNIPDQTIAEGATFVTINLDDFVTDVEDADADISWVASGQTELTVTIDASRVATITIPNINWFGSETVTFTATDLGLLSGFDAATFAVTAVNDNPVVSDIGAQTIAEGTTFATINLDDFVSDVDGADADILWSTSGEVDLTVSIDANHVATISIPSVDWYGSETITFTATDSGSLTGFDAATFTVTADNDAPVVSDIGDQTIAEGALFATIALDDFVDDIDGNDADVVWTTSGEIELSVSIDASRIATINIPDIDWNGSETITFTATDTGLLADFDAATFTVTALNDAPVLAAIGSQSVTEGDNLNLVVTATDVDGETPAMTASGTPTNATFVDNGNGTGTLNFDPDYLQSGVYDVTFYATDGSAEVDSEVVVITVLDAGNQLPVLAAIGARGTTEGVQLNFTVSAIDAEGELPVLTTSARPSGATFVDNLDGTGTFNWTPSFSQSGVYQVTFFATDDSSAVDFEIVTITINESGNQAPLLAAIGPRTVAEGALLNFGVSATDPDGSTPSLSTSTLPDNAGFLDNGNGTGNFSFAPDFTQGGSYNITFYASDGVLADSEVVVVTVTDAGNQRPVLAEIGPLAVTEGAVLNVAVTASDADGTTPTLTTSTLPRNANFINNGDGTGDFDFSPDFIQSGILSVTFFASDGIVADSEVVFITILDAGNQVPSLDPIGPQSTTEGLSLTFGVAATDPEGAFPSLSTSGLPTNAGFTDHGDGTGTFTFDPLFTQAGNYDITFTATDDSTATDFEIVTITVNEAGNQAPVLATIGAQTVDENGLLAFTVTSSDADSTFAVMTTSLLPSNASFLDNGDGTGDFAFSPDFFQAGDHEITFYASDGVEIDSELVVVTVNNVNRDPVLDPIGPQALNENTTINLTITASDPDLTALILTSSVLPANATFADNGDGTADFSFTPSFYQAGLHDITFTVDDGEAVDFETVTFTVADVNQPPVLDPIGAQFVIEGDNLNLLITAFDADSTAISIAAAPLPPNATFVDHGDGTATFDFNPNYVQSDIISLTFTVSDGFASDAELVFITISDAGNQPPVLDPIGPQVVVEGTTLNLNITGSDPEGVPPVLTTTALPTNATFVDNGDGTAAFSFSPEFTQAGTYDITFTATDDSSATDFELVTFTVTESGNQGPVVSDIGDQTIAEGATFLTINLDAFVADPDDVDADIAWTASGEVELVVTIDASRVATIAIPNADWFGAETITFTATDPGLLSAADAATFTVTAVNDNPVVSDILDQTIAEGATFATIALDDFVDDIDGADADIVWTTSGETDLTVSIDVNRIATITIPSVDWYGSESITFTATDSGLLTGADAATFTVTAVNDNPVVSDILDQTIAEGELFATIALDDFVDDIDGADADIVWTTSGETELTVSIDVNRIATITIPSVDWYGTETITFTATDTGLLTGFDAATFTVTAVNDNPVVSDIPDQTIAEGELFATIALDDFVDDIDGADADIVWTTSGETELTVSIDVNRIATITIPSVDWYGTETITFTATDTGLLTGADAATFTVTAVNDNPVVSDILDQTIAEGATFATIALDDFVDDIDGADADIVWTTSGEIELTVSIDVNRIATVTIPDVNWFGSETITFTATDTGLLTGADAATFTVSAGSDEPVVSDIPDQTIAEGATFATIALDDFVSDIDGADADVVWTTSGETELAVTIDINRIATITIPNIDWYGAETITFTATDTSGLSAFDAAIFTVTAVNDGPVVSDIGDQTIDEGLTFATVNLDDFVSDIDGADADIVWTTSGEVDLSVSIDGSRVATVTIPDIDWFGSETITFTATDTGLLAASDPAVFTVTNLNDTPVLALIGAQSVAENVNLNVVVAAGDVDGTTPTLSADPLPSGASFLDNGNGTGTFDWTPAFDQAGLYSVWFVASDGLVADSELVDITVGGTNRVPTADAGPDQFDLPAGSAVQLDGTGSSDPDLDGLTYAWVQTGGAIVTLDDDTSPTPTFTPVSLDTYEFELTVFDGTDYSAPDAVQILVVNGAPPESVNDLTVQISAGTLQFNWSAVTLDITAQPTTIGRYVIYRGTTAFFTPTPADSIGFTDEFTTTFTDNNIGGADVVGNTLINYFYVIEAVDLWENRSTLSNRVGEFDYPLVTTTASDYNLIGVPFTNTGITTADQLISAIGTGNVLTVNNYVPTSQSFQSRFAAGFGVNFAVVPGGIYQVNAAANATFSVAGGVPTPGSISYTIYTTATTDFSFIMIPFDREGDFAVAQDVINNIPGVLNTLNNFVATSQNYESRFAVGFGTNFPVRAGKPYQANAATNGTFPQ